ncbi:MAG: hypothetical protein PVH80_03290 [Anaerolineae bacterium]|jgi:hypothetical protein
MGSAELPDAKSLWSSPAVNHLGKAIVCTVAYADVFDYPLSAAQIHRYLLGMATDSDSVNQALQTDHWVGERLEHRAGCYTLRKRANLVELRQRRAMVATQMWPQAARYAQAIARLPFVRLVALTGALTMDNVDPGDDFDFLIVTEAGRLWLARAIVIGMIVKPASRQGNEVCPNYLVAEHALAFPEQNLYVAHELSQMVPLAGFDLYQQIRERNRWTRRFLPNAAGPPRRGDASATTTALRRSPLEVALRTPVGAALEHWERGRKMRRFERLKQGQTSASFDVDRCKGHFESNQEHVLEAFDERLRKLSNL